MIWPDAVPASVPDPLTDAISLLDQADGDLETAQVSVMLLEDDLDRDYCSRLRWLLSGQGES